MFLLLLLLFQSINQCRIDHRSIDWSKINNISTITNSNRKKVYGKNHRSIQMKNWYKSAVIMIMMMMMIREKRIHHQHHQIWLTESTMNLESRNFSCICQSNEILHFRKHHLPTLDLEKNKIRLKWEKKRKRLIDQIKSRYKYFEIFLEKKYWKRKTEN